MAPRTAPPTAAWPSGVAPTRSRARRVLGTVGFGLAVVVLFFAGYGPAGALVLGFLLVTPLERAFRRHHQPVRRPGLRTDMAHLLFTGLLTTAVTIVAVAFWAIVTYPITRLGTAAPLQAQPVWVQAIVGFALFEVLGYWAHRLLHQVPLFWRFHAVHHSSERLDWISAARVHPFDAFISAALFSPPLLVLGVRGPTLGVFTVLVNLWAVLLHANVRWRFGWMDGWWGTPELHHWHHSNHPEARNKNYSGFLPVLDRIFGTYYQPKDRRPEIYGIDDPTPPGWYAQLREPFRRASRVGAPPPSAGAGRLPPTAWPAPAPVLMSDPSVPPPPSAPPVAPPPVAAPVAYDERALVAGIAAGDRHALELLYAQNAGWLAVRLQRRCADRELVDTALQDTFVVVWQKAGSYAGTGDVGAWLWGIAVRKLIDQMRRRRPAPLDPSTIPGAGAPAFGGGAAGGPGAMSDPSAEAEVFAAHVGGALGDAFRRLDPDLQAVLLATAVDGLTTKEAATLLAIPQGTVKTRLARARAQMQERMA